MKFDIANYTCNGGHEINEDSFLVSEDMFIVADGLGGHDNGEVASACAIRCFQESGCTEYTKESIMEMLETAHKDVQDLNSPARTTVAASFISDDFFYYANVGDSRIYYFKKDKLFAQSRDHSVCQAAVDVGTMTYEEIRTSEDRSRLLKVLGNEGDLNLKKLYDPIIMEDGDAFIICSDGFWEFVYEGEMETDLLKSDTAEEWMNYMLKRQLLRAKNEDDNYTVICGIIHGEEQKKTVEKKRFGLFKKQKR